MTRAPNLGIVGAKRTALRRRVEMAREYVTSTSVEWIEYDAGARTLDIAFASGGVYRYAGVPPAEYERLRAAESKGRFVNEVVKQHYGHVRLRAPR